MDVDKVMEILIELYSDQMGVKYTFEEIKPEDYAKYPDIKQDVQRFGHQVCGN